MTTISDVRKIAIDISKRTEAPFQLVWPIIQEFLESCAEHVDSGKDLRLWGLGKFTWYTTKPRKYHDMMKRRVCMSKPRRKLRFEINYKLREKRMDKYGVETDDDTVKTAQAGKEPNTCPVCGSHLTEAGLCPIHGSEPFEPKEP